MLALLTYVTARLKQNRNDSSATELLACVE